MTDADPRLVDGIGIRARVRPALAAERRKSLRVSAALLLWALAAIDSAQTTPRSAHKNARARSCAAAQGGHPHHRSCGCSRHPPGRRDTPHRMAERLEIIQPGVLPEFQALGLAFTAGMTDDRSL